jgi:hypothetical protein
VDQAGLDLVKDESERIDSRFLEPACGSGADSSGLILLSAAFLKVHLIALHPPNRWEERHHVSPSGRASTVKRPVVRKSPLLRCRAIWLE